MDKNAMHEQSGGPAEGSHSAEGSNSAEGSSENTHKRGSSQSSRGLRLARLAGTHALVFLLVLSLFAAADSWRAVSGLGIAELLSVATGALAGIVIPTLVHEWFHYFGARQAGAAYDIPAGQGLFVFDWDFSRNSMPQFLKMSIAGNIGGIAAVLLLWNAVPADSWGRAALQGAAIASILFAALIEWPVIRRSRLSGDPLAELAKINQSLLSRNFALASIAGVVMTLVYVP